MIGPGDQVRSQKPEVRTVSGKKFHIFVCYLKYVTDMEVTFSSHALMQMSRRGISEEDVRKVIDLPDKIIQGDGYVVYQRLQDLDIGK